jgi:probable HAF family extracellular repeat protein
MLQSTACAILCSLGLSFGTVMAQTFASSDYPERTFTSASGPDRDENGRFVSFDFPGARSTSALGVSADRAVVGGYVDSSGKQHGFLWSGGRFVPVDYPGSVSTWAYGINSAGEIVGYHIDTLGLPGGGYRGFLLRGGSFSDVNTPDHLNTMPIRITDEGVIVGCYHDTDTMGTMHGIEFKDGLFTALGMQASMNNGASPDGALVAGRYFDMLTGLSHSYIASDDLVAAFDFPFSIDNSVWDMNSRGELVGYYTDASRKVHGFLLRLDDSVVAFSAKSHVGLNGFFVFRTIDYPGATATRAVAINHHGDVVGSYVDSAGNTHAFFLRGRGHDRD